MAVDGLLKNMKLIHTHTQREREREDEMVFLGNVYTQQLAGPCNIIYNNMKKRHTH